MAIKSTYRDSSKEPFFYYDSEKIKTNKAESFLITVNEKGIQTTENFLVPEIKHRHLSLKLDIDENMDTNQKLEKYAQKVEELFDTLEDRWQKFELTDKISKKIKP